MIRRVFKWGAKTLYLTQRLAQSIYCNTGWMNKWVDGWSNEQIHVHTFKTFLSMQNMLDYREIQKISSLSIMINLLKLKSYRLAQSFTYYSFIYDRLKKKKSMDRENIYICFNYIFYPSSPS